MDEEQREEKSRRVELTNEFKNELKNEMKRIINTQDISDNLCNLYNLLEKMDKKVASALQSDAKSVRERPKTSGL